MLATDFAKLSAKAHVTGTHRACPPAQTLARIVPLMPAFGITRLANVTGLDYLGVPVYQSIRPNSRTLSVSQGKGLTTDAAKVSALMESIEGWHAERVSAPTRFEAAEALLAEGSCCDLGALPKLSARPIRLNVPRPWVQAIDMRSGAQRWIPYELSDLNRLSDSAYVREYQQTSNGLASGNTLEEATLHALCEVVERDSYALWFGDPSDPEGINRLVDPATIGDPHCAELLTRMSNAGLAVAVLDMTSDLGLPTYRVSVIDGAESLNPLGESSGQGCHLNPAVALLRALTEAAQTRVTSIAGSRDDLRHGDFVAIQDETLTEGLRRTLRQATPAISFAAQRDLASADFRADIDLVLRRLRTAGCDEVLVVDLTHPDFQIPVVKVVVPGLEGLAHDLDHYQPGPRLQRLVGVQ